MSHTKTTATTAARDFFVATPRHELTIFDLEHVCGGYKLREGGKGCTDINPFKGEPCPQQM
jgi:hypothetical protein